MTEPIFLLDGESSFPSKRREAALSVLKTSEDAKQAFERHRRGALWIAPDAAALLKLRSLHGSERGDQRLLVLFSIDALRLARLRALFRFVLAADGVRLLPREELFDALRATNRDDLFVGGVVSRDDSAVVLYRGNLEPLVVPVSWFGISADGVRPNFDDFEVIDSGQTIRLGDYEAASDAILYEHDAEFRRRAKKREMARDASFGGALRRLRLQKNVARSDFGDISAKEIARIERGEVTKPQSATLEKIARRLGVAPADIETY